MAEADILSVNKVGYRAEGCKSEYGVEEIAAEALHPFVEQWRRELIFATG